ncbi:hypothetical protein CsatB_004233 [Cannabis sativa]
MLPSDLDYPCRSFSPCSSSPSPATISVCIEEFISSSTQVFSQHFSFCNYSVFLYFVLLFLLLWRQMNKKQGQSKEIHPKSTMEEIQIKPQTLVSMFR